MHAAPVVRFSCRSDIGLGKALVSGLTAIANWRGVPVRLPDLDRMIARVMHRGLDGFWVESKGSVGFGYAQTALTRAELGQRQPVWLPDRSAGIVADACLFNRSDLRKKLGDKTRQSRMIKTVRGVGYKFTAEVSYE